MRIPSFVAFVAVSIVHAASAPAQSLQNLFPTPITSVGAPPDDVATADFDGDGRLDVAFIAGGVVKVARQTGVLRFATPIAYATAGTAKRVLAADVTGDGKVDLVTAYDTLQVLVNGGSGGFTVLPALATYPSSFPNQNEVAVAHVDHDGRVDLVATDVSSRKVQLFLGTGGGNFAAPTAISLQPGNHSPNDLAVADFDGNGWNDIATTEVSRSKIAVILGTGGGAFAAPTFLLLTNGHEIVAGDFDGDGLLDLANTSSSNPPSLSILKGNGAGGFTLLTGYPIPAGNGSFFPAALLAADFDRDGHEDLMRAGRDGNLQIVRSLGGGAFQVVPQPAGGSNAGFGVDLGDLDSDGILDVVYPSLVGGFAVYRGDGGASFEERAILDSAGEPGSGSLQLCDANGDGTRDLFYITETYKLTVCIGDGAGGFAPPVHTPASTVWYRPAIVGNFDTDPFSDAVTGDQSQQYLHCFRGNGDGSFQPPTVFGALNSAVAGTGDYNGDGFLDVISPTPYQFPASIGLDLYPGLGNGTFGAMQHVNMNLWNVSQVEVLDLDGNGRADLLFISGNRLSVMHQTSAKVFTQGWILDMGAPIARFVLGELNGDALPDVAAALDDQRVAIALGQPGGTFGSPTHVQVSFPVVNTLSLLIEDLSGDGHADLVTGTTDGAIKLFPGDGSGLVGAPVAFASMTTYVGRIAAVDADSDGDLDVVAGASLVTLRENLGTHFRPLAYCTGKTNSLGCVPQIGATGFASASATSGFVVEAANVRNKKAGLFLYGVTGRRSVPFSGGLLCVLGPILRSTALASGGSTSGHDCTGVYSIDMNAFASGALGGNPLPALSVAGTVVTGQFWGRDPGAPSNTALSDALEYVVEP